jgi:polysaccharide export outer membrane protein
MVRMPVTGNDTVLDEYRIEPPDLLQIDLLYAVPLPPYKVQPLDVLAIRVANTPEKDPIGGAYPVDPDGTVVLGGAGGRYGTVKLAGMTLPEARAAVETHLKTVLADPAPRAEVSVVQGRGVQLVRGQHLVRPDGTVDLGAYGSVPVAGRTPAEAKQLIEAKLALVLQNPEVLVSVIGYNSKVYYVIFDYGGAGQQMVRMPVTGNDTVLDAISQLGGLTTVSDPRRVWLARSACPGEADKVLPIDWNGLTRRGRSETNYQLLPGDRVFVEAYPLVALDVALARLFAPAERVLGFSLLGTATYQGVRNASGPRTFSGTGIIPAP